MCGLMREKQHGLHGESARHLVTEEQGKDIHVLAEDSLKYLSCPISAVSENLIHEPKRSLTA